LKTQGVILSEQIKCLDWTSFNIQFVERAPTNLVEEVQAKVEPLIL
jgi:mRNA interferase MazF